MLQLSSTAPVGPMEAHDRRTGTGTAMHESSIVHAWFVGSQPSPLMAMPYLAGPPRSSDAAIAWTKPSELETAPNTPPYQHATTSASESCKKIILLVPAGGG